MAFRDQIKKLVSSIKNQAVKRRDEGKDHIILQLYKKHITLNMETKVRRAEKYSVTVG